MTYSQFEQEFNSSRNRKERPGKEYILFLEKQRPDLAEKVRNSDIDPFYKSTNLHKCQKFVEENWNTYEFQAMYRVNNKTSHLPIFKIQHSTNYKEAEQKAWDHYITNYPHLKDYIWL
jgi:hypothetical protein